MAQLGSVSDHASKHVTKTRTIDFEWELNKNFNVDNKTKQVTSCLLYTSDAADDSLRVDLGGRRIIKKKK